MCMYIYIYIYTIIYVYTVYPPVHDVPQNWDGFPSSTCFFRRVTRNHSMEPFLGGLRLSMVPSGFMAWSTSNTRLYLFRTIQQSQYIYPEKICETNLYLYTSRWLSLKMLPLNPVVLWYSQFSSTAMWRVYPTCSTADLPVTVRCWVSRPPFSVLKTKEAKKGEGLGFTLNSCNPSCGPPAVADRTLQIMRIFHQQNGAKKRTWWLSH